MKRLFAFFLLIICFQLHAQVQDDFSDGDFTSNPAWSGTTSAFRVNSQQQLQLQGPSGVTEAFLTTPNTHLGETEWEFWVRLNFSPSNQNLTRIYLASDTADVTGAVRGYFIRIGENGSADAVQLWRQDGTAMVRLTSGVPGRMAGNTNIARVKVLRSANGLWSIYSDTTGSTNYVAEGAVQDTTYQATRFFGVYARYTTTNAANFFWDDIYVGPHRIDTIPPDIISVNLLDNQTLLVNFSEPLEKSSAENLVNFFVNGGIGNPATATLQGSNSVLLTFGQAFTSGTTYTLTVSAVEDRHGNALTSAAETFVYYVPAPGDIVINEFLADPTPVIGLPEEEFIELYNTSVFPINLQGWTFKDNSSTIATLPAVILQPDSYLILTPSAYASHYRAFGQTIGLSTFPALNNTGDHIIIRDNNGLVMHAISYSSSWYNSSQKAQGGWSLELVDPQNRCNGSGSYREATDPSGGTPGRENSVRGNNPDVTPPTLVRVAVHSATEIQAFFSEQMDSTSLANLVNFFVSDGIGAPSAAVPLGPFFTSVRLTLPQPLQGGIMYELQVNGVRDCAGNTLNNGSATFGLPEAADSFDVVINEVLFNPFPNGVDFVELYNRSEKIIDLNNWKLANRDGSGNIASMQTITTSGYLLFPGDYVVLTTNLVILYTSYDVRHSHKVLPMSALPPYPNAAGTVVLLNPQSRVIDQFRYTETMHLPLLSSRAGVSLERINPDAPTQDESNWHSAAATAGFATPTYQNSQYATPDTTTAAFTLDPDVFSPDNDGYQDLLRIVYNLDQPGYSGSIWIYDVQGRLVRQLANNRTLAREGTITWDGTTESGRKANVGVYIVLIEIFNLNGQREQYKLSCTLATRF